MGIKAPLAPFRSSFRLSAFIYRHHLPTTIIIHHTMSRILSLTLLFVFAATSMAFIDGGSLGYGAGLGTSGLYGAGVGGSGVGIGFGSGSLGTWGGLGGYG